MNLAISTIKERKTYYYLSLYLISTLAICIASLCKIYTPLSPVPFTLQTLVILLISFANPFVGIFSTFTSILFLYNPITIGYRVGFIIFSLLALRIKNIFLLGFIGHIIIYFLGSLWLALVLPNDSYSTIFFIGVFPFIVPDLVKILIAKNLIKFLK